MCFGFFKKRKAAKEAAKTEVVEEKTVEEPVKEEVKAEPETAPETKPVEKVATKKAAPKAKKVAEEKPVAPKAEKKEVNTKVYHVSKRAEDQKWTIKFAKGQKVIKTFDTKVEAIAYAEKLSANQDGIVLTHASKGKNAGKINKKL